MIKQTFHLIFTCTASITCWVTFLSCKFEKLLVRDFTFADPIHKPIIQIFCQIWTILLELRPHRSVLNIKFYVLYLCWSQVELHPVVSPFHQLQVKVTHSVNLQLECQGRLQVTVDGIFFKLKQNVGNRHLVTIVLMLVILALAHNFGHNLTTVSEEFRGIKSKIHEIDSK